MVTSSVTAVLIVHSFPLPARDQRGGGAPGDDLLALLVLGPNFHVHQILPLAAFLGRPLTDDLAAAGDHIPEAHERREPHADLLDRAHAQPVGDRLSDEAHGEHAVGEDIAHAGGFGEGRITVIWRTMATMSLSPSVMVLSRATKAMGPERPAFS